MPIKEVPIVIGNGGKTVDIAFQTERGDFNVNFGGLTKREHFAAMAMQGLCANEHVTALDESYIAKFSVQQADALIEALNKESEVQGE